MERNISPKIHDINPDLFGIDSLIPQKTEFSNGVTCYQINRGSQDVVKIEFLFDAGTYYQQKKFSAFSCLQLLTEGSQNLTSEQIAQKLDFYGAYIEKEIDRDFAIISVYCLNKYLDEVLSVVNEIIKNPAFSENEVDIFKKKQLSQLIINKEKVNFVARTKFTEILYGSSHPYGTVVDMHDIELIENEDLIRYHSKYFTSSNCKILISGKTDNYCIKLIEQYFGSEKWGKYEVKNDLYIEPSQILHYKYHIEKENTVQSAVRIGKIMFNFNHPDYFKFQILNTVLGGYFGSRLMKNIREDKGYTYGIGSAILPLKHSGYFFVTTEVGKEYTISTLNEIYVEIKKLCDEVIDAEELNLVKNYKYGEFIRSIDGPFAIAETVKPLILYDLTSDYYVQYLKTLQQITAEDLCFIANKYLADNDLIELIVGEK